MGIADALKEATMWLITPIGFFSIVQKPNDKHLTVRARVRRDLDELRERYLPALSRTLATPTADYAYRATVPHAALAAAMAAIVADLDYDNVKAQVERVQGHARALVYADVWTVLHQELPRLDLRDRRSKRSRSQRTPRST